MADDFRTIPIAEQIEHLRKGSVEIIRHEELETRLRKAQESGTPMRVKTGFDPTAPDLHIGHTVVIRKMKHFQDLGHTVIFLIGDFTGMIGDPTGRSAVRKQLTREEIDANAETYKNQIFKILDPDATVIDFNSRWMSRLGSDGFVRLCAHYTVRRILERDDFENRLKQQQPISMHELLYPLVQGYDSVALEADVELGGTDQKFNLLVGRDLQREYGQPSQIVLTMPLLEGTDGVQKMSKSLDNYIGINEAPNEMFGKVMSISDDLMYRYYELVTDVPMKDIETWKREVSEGTRHPMGLKTELADRIITDFHGEAAAKSAGEEFQRVFRQREIPEDIKTREVTVSPEQSLVSKSLAEWAMTSSNSESVRLIESGAVTMNGERITDVRAEIDFSEPGDYLFKVGKRRFLRLVVRE